MADRIRELLADGLVPGWALLPVPPGRTPLHVLEDPLLAAHGSRRFYNLLDRNGFATVEELAAAPDDCLLSIYQGGLKLVAAVRQILREMGYSAGLARPSDTDAVAERLTRITTRLAEGQRLRYREFAGMLARSSMPPAALDRIVDSLSAESIPPADPLVCLLLETAGEAELADSYQGTHAKAADAGDSIAPGVPEPST